MPQLVKTYKAKVVGALSIPMMCLQTPGGVVMVISIALREGTNWTSWIMFAVAATMQGTLLAMCIIWKLREKRLGIDDFGIVTDGLPSTVLDATDDALDIPEAPASQTSGRPYEVEAMQPNASEQTPLLERRPAIHVKLAKQEGKPWWQFW